MPEFPILVGHCDNGDPECCGIIMPVVHGEQTDLRCNECDVVIATVSATEAEPTLLRMALSGDTCSETCPHCRELNTFPGFTSMEAYKCRALRPRRRDSEVRTVSVQADPSRARRAG